RSADLFEPLVEKTTQRVIANQADQIGRLDIRQADMITLVGPVGVLKTDQFPLAQLFRTDPDLRFRVEGERDVETLRHQAVDKFRRMPGMNLVTNIWMPPLKLLYGARHEAQAKTRNTT